MRTLILKCRFYLDIIKMGLSVDQYNNLEKCDLLFMCHDADRPLKLNGVAYATLIDSVREEFEQRGFKCISVAHYGSKLTGSKAFGYPISLNRKYLYYLIVGKLFTFLRLETFFQVPNFYNYLFKKTAPKVIIAIGTTAILCKVARANNILAVELLHGTGYKFIPWGWDKRETKYLPKLILSLDEISSLSLSPLLRNGIKIFTIPNPFLKRFLPNKFDLLPNEWKEVLGNGYKKRILISLSWGYWGDHDEFIEFSDVLSNGLFYEELADLIKSEQNVFWCFRLHPVQMALDKYRDLRKFLDGFVKANINCEWIQSSNLPFPIVAASCSGNITMASMSCYDAAAMGVQSLMLCPTIQTEGIHEDWFEDLVNEGYVTKQRVDRLFLKKWVQSTEKIEPRLSNLNDEASWKCAIDWILCESGLKVS